MQVKIVDLQEKEAIVKINLRRLEEAFLQAMDLEEEVMKVILIQDYIEIQAQEEVPMEIQFQGQLEVVPQEEVLMEIHSLSIQKGLVKDEIHPDQEIKH